jgi:hypothetical protein
MFSINIVIIVTAISLVSIYLFLENRNIEVEWKRTVELDKKRASELSEEEKEKRLNEWLQIKKQIDAELAKHGWK